MEGKKNEGNNKPRDPSREITGPVILVGNKPVYCADCEEKMNGKAWMVSGVYKCFKHYKENL